LALHQRITKGKEPLMEVFYIDDRRKGAKVGKKKEQLTLNNMEDTEMVRPQKDNKNELN